MKKILFLLVFLMAITVSAGLPPSPFKPDGASDSLTYTNGTANLDMKYVDGTWWYSGKSTRMQSFGGVIIDKWINPFIDTTVKFDSTTSDSTFPNGQELNLVYWDSVAGGWDSTDIVHPYYKYFPNKLYGYRHWIVASPYNNGASYESPHLFVGNDIDNMHPFIDSVVGSPTFGDSLVGAVAKSVIYNSDPALFYDTLTEKTWVYWRDLRAGTYNSTPDSLFVDISDPDSTIIWGTYTTDGLNWSTSVKLLETQDDWFIYDDDGDATPAYDSSDGGSYTRADTLRAVGRSCVSPSIIRYDGKYRMYGTTQSYRTTRAGNAVEFAKDSLFYWEADSIGANSFTEVGYVTIDTTSQATGASGTIWHAEARVSPDSSIWLTSLAPTGASPAYHLSLQKSIDSGKTFQLITETLVDTNNTIGAWDKDFIYKASIDFMDKYLFTDKGIYTKVRLVYSAQLTSDGYSIGYSDAWYRYGDVYDVGEFNTTSNSGSGYEIAENKIGVDLPMKSLLAGTNITLDTSTSGSITITSNADSLIANYGFELQADTGSVIVSASDTIGGVSGSARLVVKADGGDAMIQLMEIDNGWNIRHKGSDNALVFSGTYGGFPRMELSSGGNLKLNSAYTLPNTDGTTNYVLKTDGSGTVSWSADLTGGTGSTDSLFVNDTTALSTEGWKQTGDTLHQDTTQYLAIQDTSGLFGGGSTDSFYVAEAVSTTNGWKQTGDTIFIDTSSGGGSGGLWDTLGTADTLTYTLGSDTVFFFYTADGWALGRAGLSLVDSLEVNDFIRFIDGTDSLSFTPQLVDSMINQKGVYALDTTQYLELQDTNAYTLTTLLSADTAIGDSLGSYSTTAETNGLIGDTATILRAEIGDTARQATSDSLSLALLKTGGTMGSGATVNMNAGHITGADILSTDTVIIGTDTLVSDDIPAYSLRIKVRNNATGATLPAGTPVYYTGGATADVPHVDSAKASSSATMPAIGLLERDIANNAVGYALTAGEVQGLNTSTLSVGEAIYVAQDGGFTTTRPTNGNLVQKVGVVGRSHVTQGIINVIGAGRTNDVPNFAKGNGYVWMGGTDSVATEIDLDSAIAIKIGDSLNSYFDTLESNTKYQPIGHGDADSIKGVVVNSAPSIGDDGFVPRYYETGDSIGFADLATPVLNDVTIFGGISATGYISQWDHGTDLDISNAWAVSGVELKLQSDSALGTNSDSAFLHPSVVYIPESYLGYKVWMATTSSINAGEEPYIWVTNTFDTATGHPKDFHLFIDSSGTVGTGDTLFNPILKDADYGTLSDCNLSFDKGGKLWLVLRDISTPNQNYVGVSTSDGLNWSSPDTILTVPSENSQVSPSIFVDTNGTYKMFMVATNDTLPTNPPFNLIDVQNTVVMYSADSMTGPWTLTDTTDMVASEPFDTLEIWHLSIVPYSPDYYIAIIAEALTTTSSGQRITISESRNGGLSWTHPKLILDNTGDTTEWDGTFLYRADGYWFEQGNQVSMKMIYSASRTGVASPDSTWGTGVTDINFYDSTSSLTFSDTLGAGDTAVYSKAGAEAIFLQAGSTYTKTVVVELSGLAGRNTIPVSDSVHLSFRIMDSLSVMCLAKDSSYGVGNEIDTLYASFDAMPYDLVSVDSLIFTYRETGATTIDSLFEMIPSVSAVNADSTISTSLITSAISGASWTRSAYYINRTNLSDGSQYGFQMTTNIDNGENLWIGRMYLVCTINITL